MTVHHPEITIRPRNNAGTFFCGISDDDIKREDGEGFDSEFMVHDKNCVEGK